MDALLAPLNESQRQAVITTDGPVIIVAGAGTGKTTTLVHRLVYLITRTSVLPEHLLAITFTVQAAEHLRTRLRECGISDAAAAAVWIGTIHALCHEILRRYGNRIGISRDTPIISQPDRMALLKAVLKSPAFPIPEMTPKQLDHLITLEKSNRSAEQQLSPAVHCYQQHLMQRGMIDYDDLILLSIRLLRTVPEVASLLQHRFTHIAVDEYQDINDAQYYFIRLLCPDKPNLCVVGDADQAIYAFRGAQLKIFLSFQHDFPQATLRYLKENYRSPATILQAAGAVIKNNRERMATELIPTRPAGAAIALITAPSDSDEARFICNEIERLIGGTRLETIPTAPCDGFTCGLADIAVLYRFHQQSRILKKELEKRGIPVAVAKTKSFYDEPAVATVVQMLELIRHPERSHVFDSLTSEGPFALNDNDKRLVIDKIQSAQTLLLQHASVPGLSAAGKKRICALARMLTTVREHLTTATIETITRMVWHQLYPDAQGNDDLLLELLTCVVPFSHVPALEGIDLFLEKLSLLREGELVMPSQEAVTLMTVHMAKGLEFPVVFLTGLEEGVFPYQPEDGSDTDREEERRLFYVAMTRAREKLYLTTARSRFLFGSRRELPPSSFLTEIPEAFLTKKKFPSPPKKEKNRQMKLFA